VTTTILEGLAVIAVATVLGSWLIAEMKNRGRWWR